ncbi:MAG: hypothetical protein WC438_04500 [Candidatus Pacearchaeota archaeon]
MAVKLTGYTLEYKEVETLEFPKILDHLEINGFYYNVRDCEAKEGVGCKLYKDKKQIAIIEYNDKNGDMIIKTTETKKQSSFENISVLEKLIDEFISKSN